MLSAGTCTIAADQAGNANYNAAPQVTQVVTIDPANQTISFTNPGSQTFSSGGTVSLSATATSGLTVAFTSTTTSVCTVSGTTVSFVSAGTCSITASQAGDGTYNAAPDVIQAFTIGQASQTISATNPGPQPNNPGGTILLAASTTSGLPLTYDTTTPGVCTVSGTTVTIVGPGTCNITVSQAGNANFSPAPNVVISFAIGKAPQAPLIAKAGPPVIGAGESSRLTVTGGSGTGKLSYQVVSGGEFCRVQNGRVIALAAGRCVVKVTKAGDGTFLPASDTVTVTVQKTPTTTVLASSLNPSDEGEKVVLTATISPKVPDGTSVDFRIGGVTIGRADARNGRARLAVDDLPAGSHEITAHTAGTALYFGSISDPLLQVVNASSRKRTVETIANFLARRNDLTLTHDPDTPRQVDRLIEFNEAEASGAPAGFVASPLAPAGWSGSSIQGIPGLASSDYGFGAGEEAPNLARSPFAFLGRSEGGRRCRSRRASVP